MVHRPIAIRQRVTERFWARVEKAKGEGCWTWTGAHVPLGYGAFWDGEKVIRAHRYAWVITNGASKERVNTTTLTAAEVLAVRRAYDLGVSQDVLAHSFNTTQTNISRIVRRRTWTHLPKENESYVERE